MALSALKMFAPYSGSAASSPGGRGSGATDRIAIWANGTDLTSSADLTYSSNALSAGPSGGSGVHQFNGFLRVSGTGTGQFIVQDTVAHTSTGAPRLSMTASSSTLLSFGFPTANSFQLVTNVTSSIGSMVWQVNSVTFGSVDQNGLWTLGAVSGTQRHRFNVGTQTTVGAAGGASALPATPTGYILFNINGTDRAIPYYATA